VGGKRFPDEFARCGFGDERLAEGGGGADLALEFGNGGLLGDAAHKAE
jgi:hypothetical protein